ALGAVDLRDALAYESNVRMSRDNALGSSGMSLMGISGDNVKFLVDGVPVIGRMFNQLDLEQFNLENAKQIEVIKGPMSVIYGSNALAGTINIVTSNTSKKPRFNISANYESDGQYNLTGTASKAFGNNYFTLSGGRMFFDGWSRENLDRTYDWIPKEQYTGRLQYTYKKKDARISVRSEFLRSLLIDRGTPILPYEETAVDQKYKNKRFDNSLSYQNKIGESTIQMIISNNYFNRIKNKYYKDLVSLNEILIPIETEQDTQTFNASVFRTIYGFDKKGIETLIGFDGNHELGTGNRIKDGSQSQLDLALFASAEKQVTSYFLARAGVRYAYNSAYESPLLYSVQTKFNLRKSQLIKFAYGKGFRAPSLKELYLDFSDSRHEVFGDSSLMSETSHSFTSSYTKYFKVKKVEFVSNLDGFFNHINNKIELLVTGPTSARYGNIGVYESVGGEFSQKVKYKNLRLNLNFSYIGIFNGVKEETRNYNFSPQVVVQPSYTIEKTKTTFNVFFNYIGKISRVFSDTASNTTSIQEQDAYSMMDFTVSQPFFKKKLRLTVGTRNLFGVVNINSQTTEVGAHTPSTTYVSISPGRTIFASIKYEFKK
ncbi:MAG: TonB-dependent receptor plug domain-containing protein, partial [Bacteroidia bacterium]|nr:TonB-dependent receptor plug domain-containing protein [Bacteroidia bacterium]